MKKKPISAAASGYSGTPLAKKLGIKPGGRVCFIRAPADYKALLAPLPEGVRFTRAIDANSDVIHLFCTRRRELEEGLRLAMAKMRPDAAIWASWPKKSAGVETDIVEGTIREVALPMGLVDVKVCAVDATWSGLKLVVRVENRERR